MKVAIIGCGFVSESHITCLKKLPDIEIVGVADTNVVAANHIAEKFNIPNVFLDTTSLLSETTPEVVHLLTPPQTHTEIALEVMQSGCHLLLEKPMATTSAEAKLILACAHEYNVALAICHNFLFLPCVVAARKLLLEGAIGNLLSVDIVWRPSNRGLNVGWTKDLPGGAMHEILPHAVYLQRAFVGELTSIEGILRRGDDARGPKCETHILLDAELGSSHIAILPNAKPKQFMMRVEGTKMSLQIDLSANSIVKIRKLGKGKVWKAVMNIDQAAQLLLGTVGNVLTVLRNDISNGHLPLIQAFYKSLREGTDLPVTGEDGFETVAILDKIWVEPNA
ncbi:MAG: Gfo/Idh/MocA family oxidoreductase [Methylococcaceae bacterium]